MKTSCTVSISSTFVYWARSVWQICFKSANCLCLLCYSLSLFYTWNLNKSSLNTSRVCLLISMLSDSLKYMIPTCRLSYPALYLGRTELTETFTAFIPWHVGHTPTDVNLKSGSFISVYRDTSVHRFYKTPPENWSQKEAWHESNGSS